MSYTDSGETQWKSIGVEQEIIHFWAMQVQGPGSILFSWVNWRPAGEESSRQGRLFKSIYLHLSAKDDNFLIKNGLQFWVARFCPDPLCQIENLLTNSKFTKYSSCDSSCDSSSVVC